MNDLHALVNGLAHPRILVIGDLILDRYTWGNAERISPEAPVMVFHADREEVRLGGAASVAGLLRALEADVTLAGVTGDDDAGRALGTLFKEQGIRHEAVLRDPGRPTTSKTRYMGRAGKRHPQQILRVDQEERRALDPDIERQLINLVLDQVESHAAILVSDYAKGVCTPGLMSQVIDRAQRRGIPVLIDPARITDYTKYRRATLLAPNRVETEMATGTRIHTPGDARVPASMLAEKLNIATVLIKLDSEGMFLYQDGQEGRLYATRPRGVYDVTGAGDMVLAMMGLCQASKLTWEEAVPLANLAAGLEVEKLGVAPVTRAEIHVELARATGTFAPKLVTLKEMVLLAEAYRGVRKSLVFTNGCFDLLHVGHATYLQEAAKLGDILVVAVNSDSSVRRLKGMNRPVIGEADRAGMVAALGCVHHVLVFEDDTPLELLRQLRPEVLVKGGTYAPEQVVGKEEVESYGGKVCVTRVIEGISTTDILAVARKPLQGN
jgi:D-beta-D-heptose 7-phosphate kinase/D-beta-D-heptose 1-phosphate adenosyltransferase